MAGFADKAKSILTTTFDTLCAWPASKTDEKRIQTFEEFYPFYLSQHKNDTSRRLHVVGTSAAMALLALAAARGSGKTLVAVPLVGYGLAWIGHFFYEKNKPATFKYPLFSLRADLQLCYEVYTGKRAF